MGSSLAVKMDKFVHITGENENGLVEFDFSIGEPTMYVELALPRKQFDEFCKNNEVSFLDEKQLIDVENDKRKWKYGSPGKKKYKANN